VTDIPEDKVKGVRGNFKLDKPKSITTTKQDDGKFTVTAVFEDCPPGKPDTTEKSFSGSGKAGGDGAAKGSDKPKKDGDDPDDSGASDKDKKD
jgi:hypothetical protein